jgi:WD40 repeat protein
MFSCLSVGSVYITGGVDGVFNWLSNTSGDKIKAHKGKVHSLAKSYDGKKVYSGGADGIIMIW